MTDVTDSHGWVRPRSFVKQIGPTKSESVMEIVVIVLFALGAVIWGAGEIAKNAGWHL